MKYYGDLPLKTKMILITGFAAALSLMTPAAFAADSKPAGSGPNPFSECGIGAALFPTNRVAAALSNVIWDVGTTAVISATASPETCNGKNVQAAAFIMESYDTLTEETAQGTGQSLATLLNILEVPEAARGQVVAGLRVEMAETVGSEVYLQLSQQQKAESYYNGVLSVLQTAG